MYRHIYYSQNEFTNIHIWQMYEFKVLMKGDRLSQFIIVKTLAKSAVIFH